MTTKRYIARVVVVEVTPEQRTPARYSGQADTVTPESSREILSAKFDTDTLNETLGRVQHVLKAETIPEPPPFTPVVDAKCGFVIDLS